MHGAGIVLLRSGVILRGNVMPDRTPDPRRRCGGRVFVIRLRLLVLRLLILRLLVLRLLVLRFLVLRLLVLGRLVLRLLVLIARVGARLNLLVGPAHGAERIGL